MHIFRLAAKGPRHRAPVTSASGAMRASLLVLGALAFNASGAEVQLEKLNDSELDRGCGCSFHVPASAKSQGTRVLQWQDPGPAKVRIAGVLHHLTVSEPKVSTPPDRRARVGDRLSYSLAGQGIAVVASCRATTACKEDDDSCESTEYSATISLTTASGKSQIKAWAICGC